MDKEIEAVGNVLLQLPDERFYVLSAVVVVTMVAIAFIFRNDGNK